MKKLRLIFCSFLALILVAVSMPVAANAAAKPVCLSKPGILLPENVYWMTLSWL